MDISFTQLTEWMGIVWWPFMRFAGFFMLAPFFGDNKIPVMVRLLLAWCFAILCSGMVGDVPSFNPFSVEAVLFSFYQLSFGLILGLAVVLFMTIFTLAGQAISIQMGLSMAVMNDPSNGVSIAIIGRLFSITSMLVFLSLDAHLVVLDIFADSFRFWPMSTPYPFESIQYLITMAGWMFSSALVVAIPAIITMLLSNLTFGFMNRVAPALNVFALGFPMTMMLGLVALLISTFGVGDIFFDLMTELSDHLNQLLRLA